MSIVSAALWALVATVVAFLPMRWQYPPGIVLLIAAPVIIVMLGQEYGWLASLAGVGAFVSMFRKPLLYYWHKWREVSQ